MLQNICFLFIASVVFFKYGILCSLGIDTLEKNRAYNYIDIPENKTKVNVEDYVLVAVIDDAFSLSHNSIKNIIYKNPVEIPRNQIDDDGNGYIDDVSGWDFSDEDNDVSVPDFRKKDLYHGTYVSGIITKTASIFYGADAAQRIKIMPVKVVPDQAERTYIRDGYKGIKYAADNGADIICLAWSGGNPGKEEIKIINNAIKKGILLIASSGNFNEDKVLYPAKIDGVMAVAGVNLKGNKYDLSNYNKRIDISAPAENVYGPHPDKDNAYIFDNGNSAATALVTGAAAIILSRKRNLDNIGITEALLNSSTPFPEKFNVYGGKMGTGIVNLKNALDYIKNKKNETKYFSSLRSKGKIKIFKFNSDKIWEVHPAGAFRGFFLFLDYAGAGEKVSCRLNIVANDTIWNSYSLSNLPEKLFVPFNNFKISKENCPLNESSLISIHYYGEAIDSTTLHCNGIKYITMDNGTVQDGSGESNYANNCSCKWIITVPRGKRIKFTFTKMDTQPNIDYVYLVDGKTAIPDNFIAKFSGNNIPPVVYSSTNEVLIWFVTDGSVTGDGWEFNYEVID